MEEGLDLHPSSQQVGAHSTMCEDTTRNKQDVELTQDNTHDDLFLNSVLLEWERSEYFTFSVLRLFYEAMKFLYKICHNNYRLCCSVSHQSLSLSISFSTAGIARFIAAGEPTAVQTRRPHGREHAMRPCLVPSLMAYKLTDG